MLTRYKIYRGKRPPDDPLPVGIRQDSRKHTRHCLRPTAEMVEAFLVDPSAAAWKDLKREYLALLNGRYAEDPTPFRELSDLAMKNDVFIGCNCPTAKNPDPKHCHTILALSFMKKKFPKLNVI